MGPWDDSELLEIGANVAHVDVAPGYIEPEIIKQTQNRTGLLTEYLTKYMDGMDILKGVNDGTLTPLDRFKYFIRNFDERIERLIRSVNDNYVVDNINRNNLYRYKEDYVAAFNKFIKDSKSSLFGARVEENGRTILLTKKDGSVEAFDFADKPVVRYSGNDLVLTTSKTSVQLPVYLLQKISFDDGGSK
jgi:hypothetical protein